MGKTRLRKNPTITLVIYQALEYFQDFSSYVNAFIKYKYSYRQLTTDVNAEAEIVIVTTVICSIQLVMIG